LYGFVVEYLKAFLGAIRPGRTAAEILDECAETMRGVVEETAFSKPIYEIAARKALAFKGHLSHTVGLTVHDGGGYQDGPLVPGTVFSVDPMLWVPEEKLYVRVEDTLAVTADGIENFTAAAPTELDDVEACMKEDGLLGAYPESLARR
jgi:Xaa-Pro aminopeptidase